MTALADLLGDKQWFIGDAPSIADAAVFGKSSQQHQVAGWAFCRAQCLLALFLSLHRAACGACLAAGALTAAEGAGLRAPKR